MRGLGLRIPRERAESARLLLRNARILRSDARVMHIGNDVVFPVLRRPRRFRGPGRFVKVALRAFRPRGPRRYQDLLEALPTRKRRFLPRSFDIIGDTVLVRIPPELVRERRKVGEAILAFVPKARLVGWDRGVHGPERRRVVVRIAGSGSWNTVHRENGLLLSVNPSRAYFSPRLGREHARIASLVSSGESVLDLCCGVGPFALGIARAGKAARITAVDANPAAIQLLRKNLKRLGAEREVEVVQARLESYLPAAPQFDRVIFNLPHEGIKYLPSVGTLVVRAGALHYYEVTERSSAVARRGALVRIMMKGPWSVRESHVVHPYSPTADLVEYELRRR